VSNPGFEDTIAALATPPGWGALAVIRISGGGAADVLSRICPALSPEALPDRRQLFVRLQHPRSDEALDHALVTFFRGPRSYTGEDVVEISTHGGLLTPQLVLDAVYAAGTRPALPGEFTRRALLNGKMDLLQAEAIGDLIDARSPAMHRAALHQVDRGLSRRIDELREMILRVEALVAYSIDFPEEDEPPVPLAHIRAAAEAVSERVQQLLETAPQGAMLRTGALVVLAGRPNSGKSSLFNALLGLERSIVTEIPGTTRDAVDADAILGGYPFRLVDTAGLRNTQDRVEAVGVEVARRYLSRADVLLFCREVMEPLEPEEVAAMAGACPGRTVVVRTKADLSPDPIEAGEGVRVSVVSGEGLAELRERIVDATFAQIRSIEDEATIVTSERQRRALQSAQEEISLFLDAVSGELPVAVAAVHLRAAAGALEDLIGIVSEDDVLGAVFLRFCVGK
jgi:tRNA modification GTPase